MECFHLFVDHLGKAGLLADCTVDGDSDDASDSDLVANVCNFNSDVYGVEVAGEDLDTSRSDDTSDDFFASLLDLHHDGYVLERAWCSFEDECASRPISFDFDSYFF